MKREAAMRERSREWRAKCRATQEGWGFGARIAPLTSSSRTAHRCLSYRLCQKCPLSPCCSAGCRRARGTAGSRAPWPRPVAGAAALGDGGEGRAALLSLDHVTVYVRGQSQCLHGRAEKGELHAMGANVNHRAPPPPLSPRMHVPPKAPGCEHLGLPYKRNSIW